MATLFTELVGKGNELAEQFDVAVIDPFCEAIGRPRDQGRIFLIFLLQFPHGWFLHYCVHGTFIRHIYNILLGILIQIYLYGFEFIHVIVMTVMAYAIMMGLPRHRQAWYVMYWVLGSLSFQHLYGMYYFFGVFRMDVTSYTMLLTCKLSSLAFCY